MSTAAGCSRAAQEIHLTIRAALLPEPRVARDVAAILDIIESQVSGHEVPEPKPPAQHQNRAMRGQFLNRSECTTIGTLEHSSA